MGCVKQTSPGFARALAALGAMGAGLAMAEPLQVPPEAFSPTTLTAKPAPQPAANGPLQPAVKPKPAAKPAAAGSAKPAEAKPAAARTAAAPAPLAGPVPLPRPRPPDMSAYAQVNVGLRGALFATRARFKPLARPAAARFAVASTTTPSPADIEQLKRVIEATRKGREADANAAENAIVDPLARKLAEWVILRSDNTSPSFPRYAAFVMANPAWPHVPLFRRRAENALWNDGVPDSAVLAFFANNPPTTAKGRYMLAHALLAKGDRAGAAELVRYAWTRQDASADVESKVLELYGDMLTRADHKMRMEQRFYLDDVEAGMREAKRLGGDEVALAKARAAVIKGLNNAKALLDDLLAANAAPPTQGNWRVDRYFTAGWIALRFLHDAKTAAEQFAHITEGTANPHALSRGGYWQGRAAEAMGKPAEAKDFYERAARHTATYYGQLARARLGLKDLGLIGPPAIPEAERKSLNNLEIVRAAELLYGLNERTMLAAMFAEIGESGADVAGMAALAEVAAR